LKVFLGQTQRSGVVVVLVVVSGSVCACGLKGCALLSRLWLFVLSEYLLFFFFLARRQKKCCVQKGFCLALIEVLLAVVYLWCISLVFRKQKVFQNLECMH
jgi:uncharacterized protein YqhQ